MTEPRKAPFVSALLLAALALVAAGTGVFWQGEPARFVFETLRGESVTIQGHGLYRFETVSIAAQAIAQDVVTLLVGIPLLLAGAVLSRKGSLRGRLLLTGTVGYFLYTYASFVLGAAYNALFLLYVALFSLGLITFIESLLAIDVATLPGRFSPRLPRRSIAAFLWAVAGFLLLAWLGRIVPALRAGTPPYGLESYTTLVIQGLDLGLIVPAAAIGGAQLLKRRPLGYLLASIVLVKGLTLALAVSAMAVNMKLAGVAVKTEEMVMFPLLTVVGFVMTVVLLKNVSETSDPMSAPQ